MAVAEPPARQAPPAKQTAEAGRPRASHLSLWIAIAVFLLLAQRVFVYVPDDAFITYRYAANLAHGFGPVFNPGGTVRTVTGTSIPDRTEGYSSPLFMAVASLLLRLPLGMDMLLKAKFFGLLCGITILVLVHRFTIRLGFPGWARAATPLLLAVHSSFVVCSVNGMETILQMLLVTSATLLLAVEWQRLAGSSAPIRTEGNGNSPEPMAPVRPRAWSALLFAACALNRPEGLLFGLVALGWILVTTHGRRPAYTVRWALQLLLPVALFLLWRHSYFGIWLPNTYYAKHMLPEQAIAKGGTYLLRTLFPSISNSPAAAVVGLLWWMMVLGGAVAPRFMRPPASLVSAMACCQIVFVLQSGGDGMGGWRFMAPVVPLLMLLLVGAFVEIVESVLKRSKTRPALLGNSIGYLLCLLALIAGVDGEAGYWQDSFHGYRSWASTGFTLNERRMLQGWGMEITPIISDWLNAHLPPGSTIAYTEMGVTPYLCPKLRFLDAKGLCDHGVATLHGAAHNGDGVDDYYTTLEHGVVGAYLLHERRPDYIMRGVTVKTGEPVPPLAILNDGYPFLAAFPLPAPPGVHDLGNDTYMAVWKRAGPGR
jgi:hypothetical protein